MKIISVDQDTQRFKVAWSSELSQKSIDEYPVYEIAISDFTDFGNDTEGLLRQLANVGMTECQRQVLSENNNSVMPTVDNLLDKIGQVLEYNIGSSLTLEEYTTEVYI